MSIATEITRIQNAESDIKDSLATKQVTVPTSARIDDLHTYIDSIPSGGASGTFEYEDWIAYGTSTPDASKYKYWFPVNTTPQSKPLKYVSNYLFKTCYSGDIADIVAQGTNLSIFNSNLCMPKLDGGYIYFIPNQSFGRVIPYSTTTVLKRYSADSPTVMTDANPSNNPNIETIASLIDMSEQADNSSSNYSSYDVNNGYVYGIVKNTVYKYNIETQEKTIWGTISGTCISGTDYRGAGIHYINDSKILLFRNLASSNSIVVHELTNTTNQSLVNKGSYTYSESAEYSNTSVYRLDSDTFFIGSFFNSSSYPKNLGVIYKYSTNTFTKIDVSPLTNGFMYKIFAFPLNKILFYATANDLIYELNGTSIRQFATGNLFRSLAATTNSTGFSYIDATTFRGNVPLNNFRFLQDESILKSTAPTASFMQPSGTGTHSQILANISDNASGYSTYNFESDDSSSNVLLRSNNDGTVPSQGYKFYPEHTKDYYLPCMYSSGTTQFIYNQTSYQLQVSVNNTWVTTDENITLIS